MINKRLLWLFVLGAITSIAFPVYYVNSAITEIPALEIFGLTLLLAYLRTLNKNCPAFLYTSFYQIYSLFGIAVSLLVIGFGTPMIEISQEGTNNGAFWVTLLFLLLGLEAGRFGYLSSSARTAMKMKRLSQGLMEKVGYAVALCVLIVGLYVFVVYGSPLILGVTRVNFWQNIVSDNFTLYPSLLGQTFFFSVFIYFNRKSQLKDGKAALLVCILYIFATIIVAGEKFSTFIFYITVILAIYAGLFVRINMSLRLMLGIFAVTAAMFVLILFSYLSADKEAVFFLYRIALQGQLVWSVVNESSAILFAGDNSGCYFGCDTYGDGSDYISARYLSSGLWESYQETGTGLTGFMPSLPMLTLGLPIALVIHMGISFLFGRLQRFLVVIISQRDMITSLLVFKVYFGLLVFWYASKTSAIPGVIATAIILLIWYAVFNRRCRRSENRQMVA